MKNLVIQHVLLREACGSKFFVDFFSNTTGDAFIKVMNLFKVG